MAEEIGKGDLMKMIRLTLSDPDDEVWRYTIEVGGERYEGEEIRLLSDGLNRR